MALLKDFTAEQKHIKEQLKTLEDTLSEVAGKQENTAKFLELAREYTDIQELTKPILNELIDKVVAFDVEKARGDRMQRIGNG